METPKSTGRSSLLAPRSDTSKVRPSNLRQRLFSPDSGVGISPPTRIPQTELETPANHRHFRRNVDCSPMTGRGRVRCSRGNSEGLRNNQSPGNGWKKFWLIWVVILVVTMSLIVIAWTYFPNNRVVQKSQEYVMGGLFAVAMILVLTGALKVLFHYFSKKSSNENIKRTPVNSDSPSTSL